MLFEPLVHELGFAWKRIIRRRAHYAAVVGLIGVPLGVVGAVMSLTDRMFLRPPPGIGEPSLLRRVGVSALQDGALHRRDAFAVAEVADLASAFGTALSITYSNEQLVSVRTDNGERRIRAAFVAPNYFAVLQVRSYDDQPLGSFSTGLDWQIPGAVISAPLARTLFGLEGKAVGQSVVVGQHSLVIRAVADEDFAGHNLDRVDVWLPPSANAGLDSLSSSWRVSRGVQVWEVIVRLRSSGDLAYFLSRSTQVLTAAQGSAREERFVDAQATVTAGSIVPGRAPKRRTREEAVVLLLAALSTLILVSGLANAANLAIARTVESRREWQTRSALGMAFRRFALALTAEAVAVALMTASVAVLLAAWASVALRHLVLPDIVMSGLVDARIVGFVAAVAFAASMVAMLCGCAGFLASPRLPPTLARVPAAKLRGLLLSVQTAMAVCLLIAGGVLLRTAINVQNVDTGYAAEQLISIVVPPGDSTRVLQLAERSRRLTSAVAMASSAPLERRITVRAFAVDGARLSLPNGRAALVAIDSAYLRVAGSRLVAGRNFGAHDDRAGEPVAVVSNAFARAAWPEKNAIGECVRLLRETSSCYTIVGVVQDVVSHHILEEAQASIYVPLSQRPAARPNNGASALLLRSTSPYRTLRSLASEFPDDAWSRFRVALPGETIASQQRPFWVASRLFVTLAVLAVTVALFGLYAMMRAFVSEREHDLCIRMALGAEPIRIVRAVAGTALLFAALGILAGALISVRAAKFIAPHVYGVSPVDAATMMGVVIILSIVVTGVAALVGFRATRLPLRLSLAPV